MESKRVRVSRKERRTGRRAVRKERTHAPNGALHTVSYADSIPSDEFVKHPFYTYVPLVRKRRILPVTRISEPKRAGAPLMRNANWPRNVIAIGGSRARPTFSRLVV